jgi:soluble lytic murein transglycosylase-like protein
MAVSLATPVSAEIAVFTHGQTLKLASHSVDGDTVHLVLRGGGELQIAASLVAGFVPDEVADEVAAATGDVRALVLAVAARHGLDPALVLAVAGVESALRPDAVSPKGAQGLMQLMPATAAELGVSDPFDPEANLDGGARYLCQMLDLYNGDVRKALAAYNAGPGAVRRYGGVPPYRETSQYIQRVLAKWREHKRAEAAEAAASAPKADPSR